MDRLDKLFDSAANLLSASEKNEINFSAAIKSVERVSGSVGRVEIEARKAISESSRIASNEISNKVSKQLLNKLEEVHAKAELAADRYEKASRYSVLKLSFISILLVVTVASSIWFLFVKDIPTIKEIYELRRERAQLQADVDKLKEYGNLSTCGGELCVSVDEEKRYVSHDNKKIYYVVSSRL